MVVPVNLHFQGMVTSSVCYSAFSYYCLTQQLQMEQLSKFTCNFINCYKYMTLHFLLNADCF